MRFHIVKNAGFEVVYESESQFTIAVPPGSPEEELVTNEPNWLASRIETLVEMLMGRARDHFFVQVEQNSLSQPEPGIVALGLGIRVVRSRMAPRDAELPGLDAENLSYDEFHSIIDRAIELAADPKVKI